MSIILFMQKLVLSQLSRLSYLAIYAPRLLFTTQVFFLLVFSCSSTSALTIYVSPLGNDSYNGLASDVTRNNSGPVASLERARDIVRSVRKQNPSLTEPIEIVLASGIYRREMALRLNELDSGTSKSPTIYRAFESGQAIISGAVSLDIADWKKCVQCKEGIYAYQLNGKLMSVSGSMVEEGLWHVANDGYAELYYKGKKMPLARWPKREFAKIRSIVNAASFYFEAKENLPQNIEAGEKLWARGYWTKGWADYSKKATFSSFKQQPLVVFANEKMPYPIASQDRFFLFNGLSLISEENDWSLDDQNQRIYFWPPEKMNTSPEWAIAKNLIVAEKVKYIQFKGIVFKQTRNDAISFNNVSNVLIDNCQIYGSNGWGIILIGKNSRILRSKVSETGLGGIKIVGGNRKTLEKSGLIVSDTIIHNFAQRVKTYQAGISIYGVGALISNNEISLAPHMGIILHGNNHIIENNTIHNVMKEVSDGGAIYMGRDWTEQGIKIRNNYLYDINSLDGRLVMGVYLDDQASGVKIYDNVFWLVDRAVFIGGGKDNKVFSNIYVKSNPAIFLDERGLDVQKDMTQNPQAELQIRLNKMPYKTSKIWRSSYPELQRIIRDGLGLPRRNQFVNNIFIKSMPYELQVQDAVKVLQDIDEPKIINFQEEKLPNKPPLKTELCQVLKNSAALILKPCITK